MHTDSLKVIITGATGMVGRSVLLECIERPEVTEILLINRSTLNITHPKVKEIIHQDFFDVNSLVNEFKNYNACFFCLGISSAGISEAKFHKYTYELTSSFMDVLFQTNPNMMVTYVSGQGTDSTESGNLMWANVKGKTENYILHKGFKKAIMFRPNAIIPEKGVKSKTKLYNGLYIILKPFFPLLRKMTGSVTTSTKFGNAMINAVIFDCNTKLENKEINELALLHLPH